MASALPASPSRPGAATWPRGSRRRSENSAMAKIVRAMKNGGLRYGALCCSSVVRRDLGRIGPEEELVEPEEERKREQRRRTAGCAPPASTMRRSSETPARRPRGGAAGGGRDSPRRPCTRAASRRDRPWKNCCGSGSNRRRRRRRRAAPTTSALAGRGRRARRGRGSPRSGAGNGVVLMARSRVLSSFSAPARVRRAAGRAGCESARPRCAPATSFAGVDVLRQLQRTDVGGDRPAILGRDLRGVARHDAEAVGHDVEEVADRHLAQPLLVVARCGCL